MPREKLTDIVLRAALAFALAFPALDATVDPYSWLGYFPGFVQQAAAAAGVSGLVLLHTFGIFEVALALWLLSGWKIFYPSAAALALLGAIVILDYSEFQTLFRDLSIASIALVLALKHYHD